MKRKAFKYTMLLIAALTGFVLAKAQDTSAMAPRQETYSSKDEGNGELKANLRKGMKQLEIAMTRLSHDLNEGLGSLNSELGPAFKDMGNEIRTWVNDDRIPSADAKEKVKTYSKSYPMDANDKLRINTKFSKVVINTWNNPEVKVEVSIRSFAKNDETAQKMIDAISISDHKEGDVISFATSFGSGDSIWNGLFNNQNDHHKVEVDYVVYLPSKNAMDIDNSYGSTDLPDFDGQLHIASAYGSFTGKALTHAGNHFKISYGSATIGSLSSAEVSVSYGSLNLNAVDQLNAEVKYSAVKIGRLTSKGNINAHYAGTVAIEDLDKNFSSFSYSGSYSNLKLGVNSATNADFDITVKYGEFKYNDPGVVVTEKTPSDEDKGWKPTKNFRGHIGKGSSDRVINVSSNYGGVSFF